MIASAVPTEEVEGRWLRPGDRVTVGRYIVDVIRRPEPAPPRRLGRAEVLLLVRHLEDGTTSCLTVGAGQRFELLTGQPVALQPCTAVRDGYLRCTLWAGHDTDHAWVWDHR